MIKVKVVERFPDGSKNVVEGAFIREDGITIKVGTKHGVREIPELRLSSIRFLPRQQRSFHCPH